MTETEKVLSQEFLLAHPKDAARLLEDLPAGEAAASLKGIATETEAEILRRMDPFASIACLQAMDKETVAAVLEKLDVEVLAGLLRRMDPEARGRLLSAVSERARENVSRLLDYPKDTAGAVMDPFVFTLPADISVRQAINRLQQSPQELYYYLYVVDRDQRIAGVMDVRELMQAAEDSLVRHVMHKNVISIAAHASLASVREHPGWQTFDALPVVDDREMLVGLIRHRLIRNLEHDLAGGSDAQPGVETLLALGELYWAGMCGILGGSVPGAQPAEGTRPEKGEPDGG